MSATRWPRLENRSLPLFLVALVALSAPVFLAGCSSEKDRSAAAKAPSDAELSKAQGSCPVSGKALGSMGAPVKVLVEGEPVFLC